MPVSGVQTTSKGIPIVDAKDTGFSGLKSEDFLKILIAQLQNQDPSSPLDSDQLLSQISDIRNLQADLDLESSLKNLTLSQQITSSTSFIGKEVTGTIDKNTITGIVDRVVVKDGTAYLGVAGQELKLTDVTQVDGA